MQINKEEIIEEVLKNPSVENQKKQTCTIAAILKILNEKGIMSGEEFIRIYEEYEKQFTEAIEKNAKEYIEDLIKETKAGN